MKQETKSWNEAIQEMNAESSHEGGNSREQLTTETDEETYHVELRISACGYLVREGGRERLFTELNVLAQHLRGLWQASLPVKEQLRICREIPPPSMMVTQCPQPKRQGGLTEAEKTAARAITLEDLGL